MCRKVCGILAIQHPIEEKKKTQDELQIKRNEKTNFLILQAKSQSWRRRKKNVMDLIRSEWSSYLNEKWLPLMHFNFITLMFFHFLQVYFAWIVIKMIAYCMDGFLFEYRVNFHIYWCFELSLHWELFFLAKLLQRLLDNHLNRFSW